MDKFDVLKKYSLDKKVVIDRSLGETDLTARFSRYAEVIDAKWVEIRDKRHTLVLNKECMKVSGIPSWELSNTSCYFLESMANKMNLCCTCKFFNDVLRELDNSMDELSKAAKEFRKKAGTIYGEK